MSAITENTSTFTKAYTSFSGADISIYIAGERQYQAQSIAYSITREKAPIYVLGSADPVAFSRGKRGIAGSLIFSSVATDAMGDTLDHSRFAAKDTDLAYYMNKKGANLNNYVSSAGNGVPGQVDLTKGNAAYVAPIYYDQLLPFNVVIMGVNEAGQVAQMVIFGLEIITVGSGLSIDDTSNETQMSYVAKSISRWKPIISDTNNGFDFTQSLQFNPAMSEQTFGGLKNDGGFTLS